MKQKLLLSLIIASFFLIIIGCGKKQSNNFLRQYDYSYDNAHTFAQCYDDKNELVEIHLFNSWADHYESTYDGLDSIIITRGNDRKTYYLEFYSIEKNEERYDGVNMTYNIVKEDESILGTITVQRDHYSDQIDYIVLDIGNKIEFEHIMCLNGSESLLLRKGNDQIAVQLITALAHYGRLTDDWPVADKNLALLLHSIWDYKERVDLSPIKDYWNIVKSEDGMITSILGDYYGGGNGFGSYWQREILQYWSDNKNHVIEDFDRWIWEEESNECNFPFVYERSIIPWNFGDEKIYLFEYYYYDEIPRNFNETDSFFKERMSVLGAFKFINGCLTPVKIFKTKNDLLSSITVFSENGYAMFKNDVKKGILGIPLIDSNDYQHHGKYIIYEWNSKTGLFEYNGKIDKL